MLINSNEQAKILLSKSKLTLKSIRHSSTLLSISVSKVNNINQILTRTFYILIIFLGAIKEGTGIKLSLNGSVLNVAANHVK